MRTVMLIVGLVLPLQLVLGPTSSVCLPRQEASGTQCDAVRSDGIPRRNEHEQKE